MFGRAPYVENQPGETPKFYRSARLAQREHARRLPALIDEFLERIKFVLIVGNADFVPTFTQDPNDLLDIVEENGYAREAREATASTAPSFLHEQVANSTVR